MLEVDSRNVKALYRRAQAYIQLADLDLAELDIKKALEIDPDNRYVKADVWIIIDDTTVSLLTRGCVVIGM